MCIPACTGQEGGCLPGGVSDRGLSAQGVSVQGVGGVCPGGGRCLPRGVSGQVAGVSA